MFTFASLTFIYMKKILLCVLMLLSAVGYAQNQEIRLFSHRGGRLEFDENTMSAFKASYDAGYRGFEIDVRTFKEAMQVRTKKGNKLYKAVNAKKAGLVVSLWPGKSVNDLMLGAYLGADFLCTDIPVEYLKFAKEKAPWLKIKY